MISTVSHHSTDAVVDLTGANLADDAGASGKIGGANRIAVTHGPVERRHVAVGIDGFREHASGGFEQGDGFHRRQGPVLGDFAKYGGSGILKAERGHEAILASCAKKFTIARARETGHRFLWPVRRRFLPAVLPCFSRRRQTQQDPGPQMNAHERKLKPGLACSR